MRTAALIIFAMVGLNIVVPAQACQTLEIRFGQQKTTKTGGVTVKFLELIEDSRCPVDVNCVWAGVARIKVALTRGGKTSEAELNTMDKKSADFQGYTVTLTDLQPRQSRTSKYAPSAYTATLTVSKSKP
ncbi:MAG: hypothetical protein IT173_02325 [Acidobacteria bacterium]|nr:hypothetical protein [Acidobacteriota bacterium]